MMKQYREAKEAYPEALLLFRMGDFYELFGEDAKTAAGLLGLTLTTRDRDKGDDAVAMAGFPHHQLENYLGKLIRAGRRAAVCDQVEDPKQAKGIVRREVTRVVSAGALTDDALLDPHASNYLAALVSARDGRCGLAWLEISTGRFSAAAFPAERLADELERIDPAECLVADDAEPPSIQRERPAWTSRPAWTFGRDAAERTLRDHYGVQTFEGFGFDDEDGPAIRAAGAVLQYVLETQKATLHHLDPPLRHDPAACVQIDETTRRSLEIARTLRDGRREGSLLAIVDAATTAAGSRLLADWINHPLTDAAAISARHDAMEELLRDSSARDAARDKLRGVSDIERLVARAVTSRATPRDLAALGRTLKVLPAVKAKLAGRTAARLRELDEALDLCGDVRAAIETTLVDDCPLAANDGGMIRPGRSERLDSLRELAAGGKQWIARYQAEAGESTGIPNLKVGYNRVFGYYLEVTHAHSDKVPDHFIRKQTLKNAERYITPELKEYEEKVLAADDEAKALESEIFVALRTAVADQARRLVGTARALAEVDVLAGFAQLAAERKYCRPRLLETPRLEIVGGRHPVLDVLTPSGTFTPNDVHCGDEHGSLLLITGPNMAGKSTYIRQVALIVLLAQSGSFVPAESAALGLADRIFARVGASDELSRGQSTFMVEMTETARILNTATKHSLVVLDEIGRGTSTYDGLSLAWAIVEHLHDAIGCRSLFATHYHELTQLADTLPGVRNFNAAVREYDDRIAFLHRILPGAADRSYGVHVARIAGVPGVVTSRAEAILADLEQTEAAPRNGESGARQPHAVTPRSQTAAGLQLMLFEPPEHPVLEQIRKLDVDRTTPLDAMQILLRWQRELIADAKRRRN